MLERKYTTKDLTNDRLFNFIGIDELFDDVIKKSIPSFPPYDFYATGEYNYIIEMALAGFSKEDVEVKREGNKLEIYSKRPENQDLVDTKYPLYYHRGIAKRNFNMSWKLFNGVDVKSVKFNNGILRIELVRNVPEEQKPKLIPIE